MTARWRQVYPSESSASRRLGWRFSYHYIIHRSGGKRLIFFHTNGIFCVYVSLSLYLTTPGRPREDLDRWGPGCRHNSGERSCLTIVTIVKLYEKIKRTFTHPRLYFKCDLSYLWEEEAEASDQWFPSLGVRDPGFIQTLLQLRSCGKEETRNWRREPFFRSFFVWWFENLMAGRHQDCDALILLVDLSYKSNYVKWFKWISQILMNSSP